MTRTYTRKTKRGEYGPAKLIDVVLKVKRGEISIRQGQLLHGIPRSTLTRYLYEQLKNPLKLEDNFSSNGNEHGEYLLIKNIDSDRANKNVHDNLKFAFATPVKKKRLSKLDLDMCCILNVNEPDDIKYKKYVTILNKFLYPTLK